MKTKNIILYFLGLLVFCSCEDMFEPADVNNRPEEAMYEESKYAHGLLMYAYDRLPYLTVSTTDIATDDAVTNNTGNSYLVAATGAWASDQDPFSQWNNCRDGIQYANLFLSKVDKVKWAPSAVSRQKMFVDRLTGEALVLRALMYYYLLQAHGGYADDGVLYGVPLLTEPEDASSNFNQPRALFSDCIDRCFKDCDSAMVLLPLDYGNITSDDQIPAKYRLLGAEKSGYNSVFGDNARNLISGRVAEAVKAQIAIFAASPAYRAQSGVTSAQAATLAANVLKRIGGVAGFDETGNIWYKNKTKLDPAASEMPEILWREDRHKNNSQEKENFPPTLYGNGLINPSQNLVDAFPMASGYPIEGNPDYDPQNPYANRDPRLANCVVYHGMTFKSTVISTGVNMPNKDGETDDNLNSIIGRSTRTGYYLKKLLREDVSANSSSIIEQYHIYPRIRYTEIFLGYAEAANDAWGPLEESAGAGFTAYDVIQKIRKRAGVGVEVGKDDHGAPIYADPYLDECSKSQEMMTKLIRNERRLELCFENKRFWDLRRWQMPLNEPVKGMQIELDPTKTDGTLIYTVIDEVEKRAFEDYQWYGPIPKGEILKWDQLKQNKGWK